jgi:hypothetical protein
LKKKNYLNQIHKKCIMAKKKDILPKVIHWVLVVLLSLRALASLLAMAVAFQLSIVVLGAAYIAAVVGILQNKKWGSGLAMSVAAFDLIYAVSYVGGNVAFGATIVDVIILLLAYKEYNK